MDKFRVYALAVLLVTVPLLAGCVDEAVEISDPAEMPGVAGSQDAAGGQASEQADQNQPTGDEQAAADVADEVNAAHILIRYQGSERAPDDITRTKEEALAIAKEIAEMARAEGADFSELAKQYSDGPTGPRGGNLGNFKPSQMVPTFGEATLKLAVGEVSDPVETVFGFHIIRRQEIVLLRKASAKHILVMYKGSMRAPEEITRNKQEALARMEQCLKRAREGEHFEDLAREYSDGPTSVRGGDLGEFEEGMMAPAFDQAVFAAQVGTITDIVETPFGYHIIYRYK